jgi:hypothetical protein
LAGGEYALFCDRDLRLDFERLLVRTFRTRTGRSGEMPLMLGIQGKGKKWKIRFNLVSVDEFVVDRLYQAGRRKKTLNRNTEIRQPCVFFL